jgi:uncharacterized protein (TIGR02172 family)
MELVDHKISGNTITVYLKGHVDSSNAAEVERQTGEALEGGNFSSVVIDCSELEYLSSAGLRIILRIKKEYPDLTLTEVSSEVYEIFDMTGFTEMMTVQKAFRRMSVEGCEVIGEGANGLVYRIDPDTILKYYRNPDSLSDIERERELARKAFVRGIPTAIPYDVVRVNDGYGSVFELLNAKSLAKILAGEPERIDEVVKMYVDLLKIIHSTEVRPGEMPDSRDTAARWLKNIEGALPEARYARLSELIGGIPEDHHIVHGDYHLKNVMVQNGEALLIDMDTLCLGTPVFEFGSIFNAYLGYSELDHSILKTFMGIDHETGKAVWDKTLRLYLGTDDESKINAFSDKAKLLGYVRMLQRSVKRKNSGREYRQDEIDNDVRRIGELLGRVDSLTFDVRA